MSSTAWLVLKGIRTGWTSKKAASRKSFRSIGHLSPMGGGWNAAFSVEEGDSHSWRTSGGLADISWSFFLVAPLPVIRCLYFAVRHSIP